MVEKTINIKQNVQVKSLAKAFEILNLLSEAPNGMSLTDISVTLNIPKSTIYGLLSTMFEYSFIRQDTETGKYHMGIRIFELGHIMAHNLDINVAADTYMQELLRRFGTTVNLVCLDGDEVLYLRKLESINAPHLTTYSGGRSSLHATAVGKAILAYQPTRKLNQTIHKGLPAFTSNTITNEHRLKKELEQVKLSGYAEENRESYENIHCIAAPIFDNSGNVHYAISVSSEASSMTTERRQDIISSVTQTARMISYYMGYPKEPKGKGVKK